MINMVKLPTNKSSLFLRVAKGHFATSHSHGSGGAVLQERAAVEF